jgi:rare lipoprotein A
MVPRSIVPGLCLLLLAAGCTTQKQLATRGKRGFTQKGLASWYGPGFHGKLTANGEMYDMHALTAAHRQLPFDALVEVRNHDNGRKVTVRINDRGPFVRGRIIDLSRTAAEIIGLVETGTARVTLTVIKGGSGRPYGANRTSRSAQSRWRVQAGAFRDLSLARKQLQRVESIDRRARIDSAGELHRIVVGPFNSVEAARAVRAKLADNLIDAVVVSAD